ncbi:MAG: hypothetical protein BWX99_00993 [Deltaproteobacteria bacterium ADurb.Bin151]|jgi:hypothetical protein|nr:MAG: hypothetical protein BWX99_00993 [Deltaproteobacteria bacterium ADurb.Bin151]HOG81004.1 hypothetical protein [Smithellaceae bacterium]HPL68159.1 hypothetical protein [Smithellaceae bacterium]HQP23720.1 hypothetical protein [Smithellaceae bacterium]
MNIRLFIVAVLLLSFAQPCWSADLKGRFMTGGGAGGVQCSQFVASMEKARSLGIGTIGYVTETQAFTNYLLGFQTGYNASSTDTYDIFRDDRDEYALLSWMENYCRANSSKRFADAVIALANDRYPTRQKSLK